MHSQTEVDRFGSQVRGRRWSSEGAWNSIDIAEPSSTRHFLTPTDRWACCIMELGIVANRTGWTFVS